MELRHFDISEFDSPDLEGSGENMNEFFLEMLDEVRDIAGIPFKVNSGFRTESHNRAIGGKKNSAHTRGYAADIHVADGLSRFKIVNAAIHAGVSRIGIYHTFVHLDTDPSLPQDVIWTGR